MKEFNTTLSSLNDSRLKKISWDIHSNPSEPDVLGFFTENNDIIPIPDNAEILGPIRPKSNVKIINVPIAISGFDHAEKIPNETRIGFIKFMLDVKNNNGDPVTLKQFFQAIYDFYETQITEDQYKRLLNEPKMKKRQQIFELIKSQNEEMNETIQPKKRLREYFAGSMYFEGYDYHDRLFEYGT